MEKIAYLILAHSDPEHLNKLIESIDYNSDFYIHLDNKADINKFSFINKKSNVKIISKRYDVSWAGFNMVNATKELIKSALYSKKKYNHLILLSGADYPIKSKENIYNYFINRKGKEIIRGYFIEESKCPHCYDKIQKYRIMDTLVKNSYMNKVLKRIMNLILAPLKKKIFIEIDGIKIKPCYGSQWWAITQECANYILNLSNNNKRLDKYFKTSFAPDEMYFHTIIFNSNFASSTINGGVEDYSSRWSWNNFHYILSDSLDCCNVIRNNFKNDILKLIKRKKYSGSVGFLNLDNLKEIKESKYLFARKLNSNFSKELIKEIDNYIK